jgi:hypothetical protein
VQQKFDIDAILLLPWKCNVIESSPQYTSASITLIKDKIIFRSPFSKGFLTALKKNPIYSIEWHKDKRQYEMEYGVTVLKSLITMSADHFETIVYCPITRQIIDSLSDYETVKYWEPTLIYNNGYFYIAACNDILYDNIKDIPLTNDLKMVADYVQYGIEVSNSVIEHFVKFENPMKVAIAVSYRVECEITDIANTIKWLSELGCDSLTESTNTSSRQLFLLNQPTEELINELDIVLIKDRSLLQLYDKPVMIHYRSYGYMDPPTGLFKIIKCVNSEPVNLGNK